VGNFLLLGALITKDKGKEKKEKESSNIGGKKDC